MIKARNIVKYKISQMVGNNCIYCLPKLFKLSSLEITCSPEFWPSRSRIGSWSGMMVRKRVMLLPDNSMMRRDVKALARSSYGDCRITTMTFSEERKFPRSHSKWRAEKKRRAGDVTNLAFRKVIFLSVRILY